MLKNLDVLKKDIAQNRHNLDYDELKMLKNSINKRENRKFLNQRFTGNSQITSFIDRVTL